MTKRQQQETTTRHSQFGSNFRPFRTSDSEESVDSDDGGGSSSNTFSITDSGGTGLGTSEVSDCEDGVNVSIPSSILGVQIQPSSSSANGCCNGVGGGSSKSSRNAKQKWEDRDSANAVIVRELNELSLKEREKMFDEIHGVTETINETEEILSSKIEKMQKAVYWITNKPAYNQAQLISPSHVKKRSLLLKILRAEQYNPTKAARRLVNYFEFRLMLFGIDRLVHPIRISDLTEGMRNILREGFIQMSPRKDRSGRLIFFYKKCEDCLDWRSFLGANWYLYERYSDDVEVQKHGLVAIIYEVGATNFNAQYLKVLEKCSQFSASTMIRLASYHFLHQNPILDSGAHLNLGISVRLRMRPHFGTFLECAYRLMSYGITMDMLPADTDGNLKIDEWHKYLDQWDAEERQADVFAKAMNNGKIIPNSRDVLLGRGHPYQRFEGNLFMSELIERNREHYGAAFRVKKTAIAECIVKFITTRRGGRFLKFEMDCSDNSLDDGDGGKWVQVSTKDARAKVSHGFRASPRNDLIRGGESQVYTDEEYGEFIYIPPDDGLVISS